MPIWRPESVNEDPEIALINWTVFETTDEGERHFVGTVANQGYARVSSPIQSYDSESRVGITRSGRKYRLVGNPGIDSDGSYILWQWLDLHGKPNIDSVYQQYL